MHTMKAHEMQDKLQAISLAQFKLEFKENPKNGGYFEVNGRRFAFYDTDYSGSVSSIGVTPLPRGDDLISTLETATQIMMAGDMICMFLDPEQSNTLIVRCCTVIRNPVILRKNNNLNATFRNVDLKYGANTARDTLDRDIFDWFENFFGQVQINSEAFNKLKALQLQLSGELEHEDMHG